MENKPVWMSYEEAMFEKNWYAQKEQELLRDWGLGWIVDFCSKPKTDEIHNIYTESKQLPNS